ncbi:MAG: hypothetical protein HZB99_02600 [Candidatus Harrisonbacteria bacterium]|nr:hypothetical protein [Candidatus Harrisonbacteria bacterium]
MIPIEPKWLSALPVVGNDVKVLLKTGGYLRSPQARIRHDTVKLHVETISTPHTTNKYPYIRHTAELPISLLLLIRFTDQNNEIQTLRSPCVDSIIDLESQNLQLITL